MSYTLSQAAKATGKSKMTLQRAIKKGSISAKKDHKGHYSIDPAELHRIYKPVSNDTPDTSQNISKLRGDTVNDNVMIQEKQNQYEEKIRGIQEERERERNTLQSQVDDLRQRLDKESEERRKLTTLLTDQTKKKKGWFW